MLRWLARFSLVAVILALAGCGETELVTVEQGALGKALVSPGDLSPAAEFTKDTPEPCGPIPVLEERASEAAVSLMIGLGETRLKEAVGYFPTEKQSSAVFEQLAARERRECIRESIERLSGSSEVEIETLEPLGLSDSESLARYVPTEPEEEAEQAVNVAAIRFDLCVVAIIIFQEDGSAAAARRLFATSSRPAAKTCQ